MPSRDYAYTYSYENDRLENDVYPGCLGPRLRGEVPWAVGPWPLCLAHGPSAFYSFGNAGFLDVRFRDDQFCQLYKRELGAWLPGLVLQNLLEKV